ncbi:MAG: hypothetical protein KA419_07000 [Acidobacteria bacterium]|nr:hypothetical protein [Acidobacteriota bacterium]
MTRTPAFPRPRCEALPCPLPLALFTVSAVFLLFGTVLRAAPPLLSQVKVTILLSPEVARSVGDADPGRSLHLQTLALRLDKGSICYHDNGRVRAVGERVPDGGGRFERYVMLDRGDYLLEFLVYLPGSDRFAFEARHVSVPKAPAKPADVEVNITALDREGFRKLRQDLVFDGTQVENVFYDHMLWFRVRNLSCRPEAERDDLFERVKLLTADIEYSPYAYRLLGRDLDDIYRDPPATPEDLKRGYRKIFTSVIVDRIYAVAVRADNVCRLAALAGQGKPDRARFKELEREAGRFRDVADDLLSRWKWDKASFRKEVEAMSLPELAREAAECAEQLDRAVVRFFFQAYEKSAGKTVPTVSPIVYAEQIQRVCKQAGNLLK